VLQALVMLRVSYDVLFVASYTIVRHRACLLSMARTHDEAARIRDADLFPLNMLETSLEAGLACLTIPAVILDRSNIVETLPILYSSEIMYYDRGVL